MDGLRRDRPADDDDVRRLSASDRNRAAKDFDVLPGVAFTAQSIGRERGRRVGRDRGGARDRLGDRECAGAVRRARYANTDAAAEAAGADRPGERLSYSKDGRSYSMRMAKRS